ncbi:hypothetical protein VNO78_12125 [Psophocarpus tetragonolobus]|uniref:Alpha/beta hydrolase fold-3 domain-containing protein n=1 Tax=Psophocarpus tetragonolobus TaxID=3891 RepID=A0AAN9SNI9_PSOTE
MQSAFSSAYHNHVSAAAAEAKVIAVSVEYGLFLTRPIPGCYEDSWSALEWVALHSGGNGPEPWINEHANLQRVFIGGDSAGGNITDSMVSRIDIFGLPGVKGSEDPRIKPPAEDLAQLGCENMLVFVAEKDHLFHPGSNYVKKLKTSGWGGTVQLVVNWGLGHCFHIFKPHHVKAPELGYYNICLHKMDIVRFNSHVDKTKPTAMDSHSSEIAFDFSPFLKVYKDGRVERLTGCDVVPPGHDPATDVESKDVVISKDDDVSARIFLPKLNDDPTQKLPLLVYFHGGGFCIESPFSPLYHKFLNSLVSKSHIVAVSVHYRRAPEHPVPIAYEDSWTSLKWVASHVNENGPEEWLNNHVNFDKVFFSGDSAGANIAHHMGVRAGAHGLSGINVEGIALVHPYFWGVERVGSESQSPEHHAAVDNLWRFACPTSTGSDDPFLNPEKDPNMGKLACNRVLVFVAEKDLMRDRGWYYQELLQKCGWLGVVEVMEAKGENHVFHLFKPDCHNAVSLLDRLVSFITNS